MHKLQEMTMVNDPNITENEAKILEKVAALFDKTNGKRSEIEQGILENLKHIFSGKGEANEDYVRYMLFEGNIKEFKKVRENWNNPRLRSHGIFDAFETPEMRTKLEFQFMEYEELDLPEIKKILNEVTLDETNGNPNITEREAALYRDMKKWSRENPQLNQGNAYYPVERRVLNAFYQQINNEGELTKEAALSFIANDFPALLRNEADPKPDNGTKGARQAVPSPTNPDETATRLKALADYQDTKVSVLTQMIKGSGLRER